MKAKIIKTGEIVDVSCMMADYGRNQQEMFDVYIESTFLNARTFTKDELEFIDDVQDAWTENIKACIGMCLADANEQRFKDYNTNLKECLAWLEKQGSLKDIVDRCKDSWYNEGKIAGMAEGLTDDEKYQQGWHDALEKQSSALLDRIKQQLSSEQGFEDGEDEQRSIKRFNEINMKVKNITLVITDPCYIENTFPKRAFINESTIYGDWSCMCYKGNKEEAQEKSKEWNEFYFDFFNTFNFSGKTQEEKNKLYDDFKTKKDKWISENCYGEFCADSGRVAVYDYNELSEQDQKWIKEHDWCACIIPNYTGEFEYIVEGDGDDCSAHIVGDGFYTTQSGL